jgi:hypothetical protein
MAPMILHESLNFCTGRMTHRVFFWGGGGKRILTTFFMKVHHKNSKGGHVRHLQDLGEKSKLQ